MKTKLLARLSDIVELLVACGWQDKAEWFNKKRSEIIACKQPSQVKKILREIERSLFGMGSFTDLPLQYVNSKLPNADAAAKQWQLAKDLSETIDAMISNTG